MSSADKYDAVVIGSGQGGTPLASAFAKAGKKVALIESQHLGGCCINEGCTPTKTMVASGRVAYLARRSEAYGVRAGDNSVSVDMERVRQRKRDIINSFRGGTERRVASSGVEVYHGTARFIDANKLIVSSDKESETTVAAEKIFINAGARPAKPNVSGLDDIDSALVLNSTTIQELEVVPSHLIVLGGGYIGLEFTQLFRRLGSDVTIIQRGGQLLPKEDTDIAEAMTKILREDGIEVLVKTQAKHAYVSASHPINLEIQDINGNIKSISGSHLLAAAGRTPNTDTLSPEAAGIKLDNHGYIIVNEALQTSVPHIYALGDIKGGPAFTHIAYDDFRIIESNLLSNLSDDIKRSTSDRTTNYVVYTDPQLGHIGLHEYEARQKYPEGSIQVAKMPMAYVARALETDESRGMMKAVVEKKTKKILGFTCLGLEGGEVMSVMQMAMLGDVPWDEVQSAIFAHPSLAESLNNVWGFLE